jgi:hypothetical protein
VLAHHLPPQPPTGDAKGNSYLPRCGADNLHQDRKTELKPLCRGKLDFLSGSRSVRPDYGRRRHSGGFSGRFGFKKVPT